MRKAFALLALALTALALTAGTQPQRDTVRADGFREPVCVATTAWGEDCWKRPEL
ncbi:hypothetical protein ACWCYY_17290 [Kitasatospora sp. NPDC001664]|uniref:hypothetical protein n=1 Tax=Kitasatospora albolonga TaxID=68173 RepID=UPI0035E60390